MCFYAVYYVRYGLIKMEQTLKICYNSSFPFGRCTNCMFKNLPTNKTETVFHFSVAKFDSVIWSQNHNCLSFLYALIFRKQRQYFGSWIRLHPHMNKKGNTYRV